MIIISIKLLYKYGKPKALTLSYDDGVCQDIKLISILNKYNIKCTFNLNSGLWHDQTPWQTEGAVIYRMAPDKLPELYNGHEVAMHMVHHPRPLTLTDQQLKAETLGDQANLQRLFGYKIRGLAYPFGDFDERVVNILRSIGVAYARTVRQTESFSLPKDFLVWDSTCHHNNHKLIELADSFLNTNQDLALFYLWGHSYEFDLDNNWDVIEIFCKKVANHDDIWFATNIEIYDYINALNKLVMDEQSRTITNYSDVPLWIELGQKVYEIPARSTLERAAL
ncbi:MAG TPA: polysaccharide deacetylase family protein [Clostridiales bacterium]|nr:polysaccharide deacetylase family protein [Clostridiales bacterium]